MADLKLRVLSEFDGETFKRKSFVVCDCGYPVWRFAWETARSVDAELKQAARRWQRKVRLAEAGGKHTSRELRDILVLQDNRCIYCDTQFTDGVRPTADHVLPVVDGGTDWAFNIVMACRSCNSQRGEIPFRTHCQLLSPKQNEKIIMHLGKRLTATDLLTVPPDAVASFDAGLSYHNPEHGRFLDIQSISASAKRNAARNELLPRTRSMILRGYRQLLRELWNTRKRKAGATL